jgi:hypothetical protein
MRQISIEIANSRASVLWVLMFVGWCIEVMKDAPPCAQF